MMPHERPEFRQVMGHVWQGFSAEDLGRWCASAGLDGLRYHPLPADPAARGPTLFAAAARRRATLPAREAASALTNASA